MDEWRCRWGPARSAWRTDVESSGSACSDRFSRKEVTRGCARCHPPNLEPGRGARRSVRRGCRRGYRRPQAARTAVGGAATRRADWPASARCHRARAAHRGRSRSSDFKLHRVRLCVGGSLNRHISGVVHIDSDRHHTNQVLDAVVEFTLSPKSTLRAWAGVAAARPHRQGRRRPRGGRRDRAGLPARSRFAVVAQVNAAKSGLRF